MRVQTLLDRLFEAGRRAGFETPVFARLGSYELPALIRAADVAEAPTVYLSAGVHGDEPAGPLAVLELLRKRALDPALNWSLLPVINPAGLEARTRGNGEGIDLNRDYGPEPRTEETRAHLSWLRGRRFDLAVCLHEDYETDGAYLYELRPTDADSKAARLLKAMRPWTGIETRPVIDEMPNRAGLMDPPLEKHTRDRKDMPEALHLFFNHTAWCYTIETPSQQYITQRVAAQTEAVLTLAALARAGAFQAQD